MSAAHYCTMEVAPVRSTGPRAFSQAAILATCAAVAAFLVMGHRATAAEAWSAAAAQAATPSLTTTTARPLATQYAASLAYTQAAEGLPISGMAVSQPAGSLSKAAALGTSAVMFFGAAVALAARLFAKAPAPAPIVMASVSSKKEVDAMRSVMNSLDMSDIRMLSRGGPVAEVAQSKGIDEVAKALRADQASRKDLTPKDVILEMQRGNGRFWMGLSERPDMSAVERRALILAQAPKIAVLSCSDSRVPVELIFDQGLGEIFVVRMAGNILDDTAHGSLEFAVKALGVKVVMVIGHEGCGAVKGAITMSTSDISKEPADLQVVLNSIKNDLDVKELNAITDGRSRDREAIVRNTSNQVKKLQANSVLADEAAKGSIMICGAFYEISSGIVDFFSLDKNGLVVDL